MQIGQDIKEEFKISITSTQDTRIMELKNIIDNQFSEFNCIIENWILLKKQLKIYLI